jgi:hypothetical protein
MKIEDIRDDIAGQLGAVYEIISVILDSIDDDAPECEAILCNDNTIALLEYALGYADSTFLYIDKLNQIT